MSSINDYLKQAFNLTDDNATHTVIKERILGGANVKGSNLSILILAIMIASIGLNMDSTAVIIGAMLISPLMGPIMGAAFGVATTNIDLVKKSLIGFGLQIAISLIASSIYFELTPISTSTSELLARTSPTIWDVLIAVFGGFAGAIGMTRKVRSNVVPGVAIATALMPPLCTVGYGIATGQASYAFGAFYLFLLNSYFICLTSVAFFFILKVPKDIIVIDHKIKKKALTRFIIFTIVIIIPSIFFAYRMVQDEDITGFEEQNSELSELLTEAEILFPEIEDITAGTMDSKDGDTFVSESEIIVYVNSKFDSSDENTLLEWLETRAPDFDSYKIVQEVD